MDLDERRAEVLARLSRADSSLGEVRAARGFEAADDEHDPEGSTLSSDWSLLAGMRADAAAQLSAIDAALGRLAAGTHGVCLGCGRGIPPARLEARPEAAYCVPCGR